MNTLYYGDNLPILREHIQDESVDLIYLDPPFNSNRSYNVLFKDESGSSSDAQIAAFDDTWHWGPSAEAIYDELVTAGKPEVGTMISALRQFIGENQMMAYLVMMAARLVELHRVLKPTGSLYLHCDPTASHYLKLLLDTIFGSNNFQSEIIWKRSTAHSDTKQGRKLHGHIHDVILFFTKSDSWVWNPIYTPYDQTYIESFYHYIDEKTGRRFAVDNLTAAKLGGDTSYEWRVKRKVGNEEWESDLINEYKNPLLGWEYRGVPPYKGRFWAYSYQNMVEFAKTDRLYYASSGVPRYKRFLDEMPGVPLQDIWSDIPPALGNQDLGYPTQKPLALLERIIQTSSNPGDLVLDPFSGCGTAISAAQKLGRQWIGIDITYLAIAMHKNRLKDMFNLDPGKDYKVIGEPMDHADAHQLAHDDRYQFQWWALSMIQAMPLGGQEGKKEGKKGADRGIDGVINFIDDPKGKLSQVLVQVKSGGVNSGLIRDLRGVIERDNAAIGVFITLEPPTSEMKKEAVSAGFYTSPIYGQKYPRLQILCIEDLLKGEKVKMPPTAAGLKKAERIKKVHGEQASLDFDET
jgi:DNA modification methylase